MHFGRNATSIDLSESSNSMSQSMTNAEIAATKRSTRHADSCQEANVFAFKSSMERDMSSRVGRPSNGVTGEGDASRHVEVVDEGDVDETEDEHCRRSVMDFAGDTTLIRMAFGDAVLASRLNTSGTMEILLRR